VYIIILLRCFYLYYNKTAPADKASAEFVVANIARYKRRGQKTRIPLGGIRCVGLHGFLAAPPLVGNQCGDDGNSREVGDGARLDEEQAADGKGDAFPRAFFDDVE